MILHLYSRTNHLDFTAGGYYDAKEWIHSIHYWDVNNLYDYAMKELLPVPDFILDYRIVI